MTTRTVSPSFGGTPTSHVPPADAPAAARPRAGRGRWVGRVALVLGLLVAAAAGYWWFTRGRSGGASAEAAKGPGAGGRVVPIVAATATSGDLPIYLNGLGTVTGLNTVTLRTRVDGELTEVAFEEGQTVEAGQFLAQIDPRPFDVMIQQSEGQLAKDEAALANAKKDRDRYREAGDAISRQQVDTAEAAVKQSEGAVATDRGQLANAQLQKTYSRVVAPIPGRIGLRLVDKGNVVHASDASGLAVITQVKPIAVVFTLPQDDIPRLTKRVREVEAAKDPAQVVAVDAYDRDGQTKIATGRVLAVDNQVDPNSGTVRVKATFPNDDQSLYPNQFVNARLLVDVRRGATIVPPAALQRGPDSTFVYVVKADETVEVRPVQVGPSEGDRTVIESGLSPGEVVATDGVDKLRAGTKVKATLGGSGGGRQGKGGGRPASGPATRPAGAAGGGESHVGPGPGGAGEGAANGRGQGRPGRRNAAGGGTGGGAGGTGGGDR